jgi:CPA2 family monovalent cation:H+ antiporter-2
VPLVVGAGTAATLLLELGGILLALAVGARVAHRMGLSPIPLYLLAGLLFGPGGPFSLEASTGFIEVGAEVGVVLLLFMLGLEYSPQELARGLRTGYAGGALDLILNAGPGLVLGLLLGFGPVGAASLAGITYISSSGIIAKLVADMGWLGNRETPVVLTLLVLEDLVMAVYLPLLAAALIGAGFAGSVGALVAVAVALVIVAGASVLRGDTMARIVLGRTDETVVLGVLGITLLVSGLADRFGVSAAVGAFLVGLSLSGETAERSTDVLLPLRDLFAAAFFVFFGLQIDVDALGPVAGWALLLAAVTALTKGLTGWVAARTAGIGTGGRQRAAALLMARGEFSIVIAELALAAGLDERIGPLAAAYVLMLAVAGPVVVRIVEWRRVRSSAGPRAGRPTA